MTLTFPDPLVTSGTGDDRAAFVQGFIDLALFLATHEEVPQPGGKDRDGNVKVFVNIPVPGRTIQERKAALDEIAARMRVHVTKEDGTYYARSEFGPVVLEAHIRAEDFTAHLLRMFDAKQAAEKGAKAA
jgi:hypothetical protein